ADLAAVIQFLFSISRTFPDLHSFPTRRSSDLRLGPAARTPRIGELDLAEATAKTLEDALAWVRDVPATVPAEMHEMAAALVETRSEEHTSELQSRFDLVCRLLLEKKNTERR